ncbi:Calx-beta domain-containing protein [uncultured Gimesia sp.]|uniref:Calx-beta domain-containing protein n=1 Tax=uncultured Gimesia sp. TaxID=1678688 RepID=UPI00261ADCC5|nr:Calx-beta domain-containing protein [uncultured Gimesia sp.]
MGRLPFMSSFRQPISLLSCLRRGQRKRQNRQKFRSFACSYTTAEQLEDRTLLAGASLVNIEPNIDISLVDGEEYNEAPTELTFKFTPGQEIDPATLGGIQIVRSGENGMIDDINDPLYDDIVIQPGYIGIGDNPNEVILRFAESLPDDTYQITIYGVPVAPDPLLPGIPDAGIPALLNLDGEAFQDLNEDGDGANQTINFELDLGAKVVAVVPQPILRDQILTVDDVLNLQDGDTFTITVGGASSTFEMDLDGVGLNDPTNIQVIYTAGDSASDIATTIETAFNSSILNTDGYATISPIGADLSIQGNSFTPAISFSLVDPANPAFIQTEGGLSAKNDQILIYFNNDDLNPDLANDSRFYQVIDTSGTPIDTANYTATYDALSDVTVLEFATALTAGERYRLRVGVSNTPDEITEETYTTFVTDSETISILAGNGGTTTPTDGMSITDLDLNDPSSLVVDGAGNYYFVHNDGGTIRILRVDHATNNISIIAGNGSTVVGDGSATDPVDHIDTLASSLALSGPRDLALDVDGNLYLTDGAFVLKIDAVSQLVTVIAGGGSDTLPELGDVPTDLMLDTPDQLTVDSEGNIYFHDSGAGLLILIDQASGLIGGAADIAPLGITDLEVDSVDNLFIVTPGIFLTPFYAGIYFIDTQTGSTTPVPIAGGGVTTDPTTGTFTTGDLDLSNVTDIAFDADGFLYYTDSNGFVVKFDPTAIPAERFVEVIAGDGGVGAISDGDPAITADLNSPTSLAIGTGNTPYFFDNGHDLLLRVENLPDQNSSFNTATDLTDIAHQWNAGTEEFVITSEIQPQGIGLPPLAGGSDEPGHRHLPLGLDFHVGSNGTNPVVAGSITVAYYNFRDDYGNDVQGNPLNNAITEEQKQRAREVFEIYAYYLGIEFIESANQGLTIVTGDLRASKADIPVGPGGVLGLAPVGSLTGTIVMDATDYTDPVDDVFGGDWMNTAFHEIGHTLGLQHAYDIPAIMGNDLPQASGQTVFPGDYDLIHFERLYRKDANDIDLYEFQLDESGTFRAEVFAERLQNVSLLNSALTLYDENHNVIARNDDYFSNDSFLELSLAAGTYFVGITSTGNTNYNPEIENSGDNGTTDGQYELRLNFAPDPVDDDLDPANIEVLLDETGTPFDGDSDGTPGGAYDFWFVASDATNTIYVDKTAPEAGANGSLTNAYPTIVQAIDNVGANDVIRILGNGGIDGDLRTTDDNDNYSIGFNDNFNPLEDGESIVVPQGVTVVIDQGAVIKLQNTVIDVGSSSVLEDRSQAALQILGTPDAQVVLTAYGNDAVGGDDDGPSDGANPGDWGGIIFRADSDYEEDSRFLNHIANADISYGGGQVFVEGVLQSIAPIHIYEARPTLAYNSITFSSNSAISADPNSFNESIVDLAGNYNHDQTLQRLGPDIYGNTIVNNSINGLFVRAETLFGQEIDSVSVTARFDDTDIVHVITENLFIDAGTGGPIDMGSGLEARYSGSVRFDPGMIVKLGGARIQTGRGNAGIIAEGTEELPIIFTSIFDDRYGAGGSFDTTNNNSEGANERLAIAGDWGGFILNQTSHGSIDHAIIAYAGGVVPIEGLSDSFNTIEVHQADLRVANTLFEDNAAGRSSTDRNSLGQNEATTIFVRGAQPIIVNNRFENNGGSVVDINANSLKSDILEDYGRSTGVNDAFDWLAGNAGPLVRLNRFEDNGTNGMVVRGEDLTVESVWDDIDIDHVVYDTITVDNFHTYGGLRLQSSTDASLVVKFGTDAGFTATGHGANINDRIGGIVQILGTPLNPVVLTSILDDTIGSGVDLDGFNVTETVSGQTAAPSARDWTGLQFLEFSHDRNVAIINESELAVLDATGDINGIIRKSQFLGDLAPDEKSGDENRRLGFEVHGSIANNNSGDADIYSFNAEAGTDIWIDIDRTGLDLDTVIELLDPLGRVLAIANNNTDATNPGESAFATTPAGLIDNPNFGGDFYSSNPNDAGMRLKLPGLDGILTTYFVRVRSNSSDLSNVTGGQSSGEYQLQIRLRQVDEEPGSTVRHADIRYATDAIYLAGLPAHSPLINETVESNDASPARVTGQNLGNLLASDRNTIGVSGELTSANDIDFYQFELTLEDLQGAAGVNAGGKTWATIFDIDYADGLGHADTTLSVFDSTGRLIFVSRESNVDDDQPGAGQGADADDITRGSFGTLDPYIGSVHLPEAAGTYYVAVSSNRQLANALQATYDGSNPNALVRLEPINSLQRVVEDHIGSQGYSSNGVDIEPDDALFDITDMNIDTHVTGFDLSDVVLFTTNGHNLATVDPQQGVYETNIGDIAGISTTSAANQITDLVMRSDGILFGIQNNQFIRIDTAGSYNTSNNPVTSRTSLGTTNIPAISGSEVLPAGFSQTTTNLSRQLSLFNNRGTGANDVSIDAMTFARVGTQSGVPVYELYYTVTESGLDAFGVTRTFQKLYQANPNTGAVIADFEVSNNLRNGFRGYLLDDNVTVASVSDSGSDADNNSGRLYIQSVVPGSAGNGISVNIVGHDDADSISVAGQTITIRLDQRNSGSASWSLAEIASAINNHDRAKLLVKAGVTGTSTTNAYESIGTGARITSGGNGSPDFSNLPRIQGMAFNSYHVNTNGGTPLFGVTNDGKVLDISLENVTSLGQGLITSELADHGALNFTGAALGPQNLYDRAYSDYVFATTDDGTLVALDSAGALMDVFGANVTTANSGSATANLDTAASPGNFESSDRPGDVLGNIQGLAFSPLDFNLWHTTRTQGTVDGHGINAAPDNSRVPSEIDLQLAKLADDQHSFNQSDGALSFYFGLEQFTTADNTYLSYEAASAQLGIWDAEFLRDLTSNSTTNIGNNVNLPGGALGSLETNSFSLAGYAQKDAPTLYFSYFLDTEETDSAVNVEMRDSARAFISIDNGATWILVATNNSTKSTSANDWELPTYITHTASENTNSADFGRDFVQELFDSTDVWRQARIDLSNFAGEPDIKLRFDYSTAGTLGTLNGFESDIRGGVTDAFNSSRRGQNNTGEGFYIDDIIVGFAERGEMVTNANVGVDTFFDVYGTGNPESEDAAEEILTGSYNLEIRRASEYALLTSETDPFIAITQRFDTNTRLVEEDGLLGDDNFRREQGMILIEGNQILESDYGIKVETVRGDVLEGWFPHQGGTRVLPVLNTEQLAPGAVLENNLIVNSTFSGIDITGDILSPESVIPVVKVVNNTIHGGLQGINVFSRVSPTIVNNIVSNTVSGITVDTVFASAVIDANIFQSNLVNGNVGSHAIDLGDTEALFVDAASGNFYLADNSKAIDSSLNRLADRALFKAIKDPLGIPASDIFAPGYDAFGQLRVDDPTQSPPPGLGSNIFKDRGAIERADFVGPTAGITLPPDNEMGVDLNSNLNEVYIESPELFTTMIVELRDTGIGIDDAVINSSQFTLTAETSSSLSTLVEGVDYFFSYNSNTNEAIFTSIAGVFSLDTLYTVTVQNEDLPDIGAGVRVGVKDLAGNLLQPNQADGSTLFIMVVTDGENNPPVNQISVTQTDPMTQTDVETTYTDFDLDPPLVPLPTTDPGFAFEFSDASGYVLSVTDPDAFLSNRMIPTTNPALNGEITVTLSTLDSQGTLAQGPNTDGITFGMYSSAGRNGIIMTGQIDDINLALKGVTWTPDVGFYNNTAEILMETDDNGNFFTNFGDPTGTDSDTIEIEVTDLAKVDFESGSYTIDEDGSSTMVVKLTRDKIGLASTVDFSLTHGTTENDDFNTTPPMTASFGALEFSTFVIIDVKQDQLVEADETFTLSMTGFSNAQIGTTQTTTTVTIRDDDQAVISIMDSSADEDAGTMTFTVGLTNEVDINVEVGYSITDVTTSGNEDYTSATSTVTFGPNSTTAMITVTIVDDTATPIVELDEEFLVTLLSISTADPRDVVFGPTLADRQATGTILDDDSSTLSIADVSIVEGTAPTDMNMLVFDLTLTNAVDTAISVDASTGPADPLSAIAGTDYLSKTDELRTFAANTKTQTFSVMINPDNVVELNETLKAILNNLQANGRDVEFASGTMMEEAIGTIENDDSATFTIRNVSQFEANEIFTFDVSLTNPVDTAVSINVASFIDTATSTTGGLVSAHDFDAFTGQMLNFAALETETSFTVMVHDDDVVELNESFTVELNRTSIVAGLRNVIPDDGAGANITATGTIINDDSATLNITSVSDNEDIAGGEFEFMAILSQPVDTAVNFTVSTIGGTAFSGIDFTALTDLGLTFGAEITSIPFDVVITDDDLVELPEQFSVELGDTITFGPLPPGTADLARNVSNGTNGVGTINNDDAALITITPSDLKIVEGSTNGDFTEFAFDVNMDLAVDTDISFNLSTQDGSATAADGDYIPVIDQLFTFTGTPNSDTDPASQQFIVQVPHDSKVEMDEIFNIIRSNFDDAGREVSFGPIPQLDPVAQGTIENDDSATISINNVSQRESDGQFVFTATLSQPVDTSVSVEVYTDAVSLLLDDDGLGDNDDYVAIAPGMPLVLTFDPTGPLTQQFTVTVNDDNIVEDDEIFNVILDNLMSDTPGVSLVNDASNPAEGVIINDDSATFTITPVIDTEDNGPFQFLVELSNPVDVPITVEASTIDGTATSSDDFLLNNLFDPSPLTLTFDPGVTQQTVFVSVFEDGITEGPETFEVILETLDPNGRDVFLTSIASRSSSASSDAALAVDVVGDFAYVADRDGGLQVFNVADPSNPFNVGSYDFNNEGIAQGIDVVGTLAYLAVGEAGLQILDVSDPSNPTFVGSISTPARARGIQVLGTLAYVADDSGNGGGLQIFDVTDPENPFTRGSFGVDTPGGFAGGVRVVEKNGVTIAYLTDGNNGLQIINVSDPDLPDGNMTQHATVNLPTSGAAIGLDVVGDFAYVVNREGGFHIIDISDPFATSSPGSIKGTLPTPGIATGVRVVGNFAYVADSAAGLQVIDITNPNLPILADTFDTPGSARSLHVILPQSGTLAGTLAFVADTFNGLQILEFFPSTVATGTILDPGGAPLTGTASAKTIISTSLVSTPTSTDANGETGSVPQSEQWIDEWDSFWIEVWGTTTDGSGISGGTFDLTYNTDFFTATAVEFGSAFGNSNSSSINDLNGTVSGISGQNNQGILGSGNQVLLGRVKFESLSDDGVSIDKTSGFLGPHNLEIQVVNAQLDISDFGDVTASVAQSPTTELWAVPFDLDDNGVINFRDLITFASYYGTSVIDSTSGIAWSLDFDKSGEINFRDLTYFAANYDNNRASGQNVAFPPNFPKEWYGSSITTEGDNSLNELIDSAVDEWKTATGNEDLAVQVVVTDLGGQQLGEGQILELDENGVPVKGRVYIDDDAAGLGWYSSIEGLSFDSNGQAIAGSAAEGHYDLYTVLLHEIGHAAGFNTGYSAFSDHVETNNSGQVQFVSWDFMAPLTNDGLHIDENFYPNDLMGHELDPSTRKMISTLDVQILQAAYANAAGAAIVPIGAPLMAAAVIPVSKTTETTRSAKKSYSTTAISSQAAQPLQTVVPSVTQEPTVVSEQQSEWNLAPSFQFRNSVISTKAPTDLDQLVGSLLDNSYETEQIPFDEFGKIRIDETSSRFDFAHDFELEEAVDREMIDEEFDNQFADWSGPLI